MISKCSGCGKSWGGLRSEHCKECHHTFTGATAGDMHRVGKHGVREGDDRRRCLTVNEMGEAGMVQNAHGVWGSGGVSPWSVTA